VPGSGAPLRQAYVRYLLIAAAALVIVLVLVVGSALAVGDGGTVPTIVVGIAATVVASLLLFASLLRGGAAVAADTLSIPVMRSSGALALAAQAAGWARVTAALILGFLQRLSDVELAVTTGLIMAICSAVTAALSAAAHRMSRRLTS
jgi:hypothetical protein